MLVFTVPLAFGFTESGAPLDGLAAALLPLWFTAGVTLAAMVLVGLPLTAALQRTGRECWRTYTLLGLLFGALIPFAYILAIDGAWEPAAFFAVPGMLAGTAAGYSWGRWRRACTERSRTDRENPIHDLLF